MMLIFPCTQVVQELSVVRRLSARDVGRVSSPCIVESKLINHVLLLKMVVIKVRRLGLLLDKNERF